MKKSEGLTFIEILIAIVIVAIVLSSMFTGLNFASKYARHNANKTMALNFAQAKMEELRNVTYGGLAIGETTDPNPPSLYQKDGVSVGTERKVNIEYIYYGSDRYKKVIVTVSWDWQGKSYVQEVNTLRSDY